MKTLINILIGLVICAATLSPPIQASQGQTVRYQHTDMLGTPVMETDESGNVISRSVYEPFGKRLGGEKAGIGFTGHLQDEDLGLTYMQARYYDPVIGRFYSNDPMGAFSHLSKGNIHGFNRYAYANNNPYKYTDPDGRESLGVLIGNWLSGKSLKESAQSTHKTNMIMAKGAKEALSFTKGGLVVDVVETTNEVLNSGNIADNLAGMSFGEIAGAVIEKVLDKKLSKEGAEVVSAVVGKFSGDAAKNTTAKLTETQNTQEKEVQKPVGKEHQ